MLNTMEEKEGPGTSADKKEGVIERAKDIIKKVTDRRLRSQFQNKPEKPHFDPEEEIDDSLDEPEYDEDDPQADV